jgi:hypothetical protein
MSYSWSYITAFLVILIKFDSYMVSVGIGKCGMPSFDLLGFLLVLGSANARREAAAGVCLLGVHLALERGRMGIHFLFFHSKIIE